MKDINNKIDKLISVVATKADLSEIKDDISEVKVELSGIRQTQGSHTVSLDVLVNRFWI